MADRLVLKVVLAAGLACGGASAFAGQDAERQTAPPTTDESAILDRLLSGATTRPGDEVIARFEHATLTRDTLLDFLLQSRGLDAMLNLMQLQIARALAAQEGIAVTRQDVAEEQRRTLQQAFAGQDVPEDQYEQLLDRLLTEQQLSRVEFDVVMATNAYLKALARPRIEAALTEENLRKAFNIRYGEQVLVRHIQLENLAQVAQIRSRLDAGEDFATLAQEVSRNTETKRSGGLFPAFSMQSDVPESFKVAAFEMEPGEVSDPVEAGGFYHILELQERIPPKAVKFEDVQEDLKKVVTEEQLLVVTSQLRRLVAQMLASPNFEVSQPILAEQLRRRLEAIRPQPMDPEAIKQQMESQRPEAGPSPATRPATQPAGGS